MDLAGKRKGIHEERIRMLQNELRDSKEGFGLINVGIRIKLHYGESYGIQIASGNSYGTKVTVCIPIE